MKKTKTQTKTTHGLNADRIALVAAIIVAAGSAVAFNALLKERTEKEEIPPVVGVL
ncbi:hypothetical protein M6D81_10965 [Paenibacillus sp. J5C_2022]|uniref:hypothetical protein n=1 Tax=Paenibacillus sp. J5C2022 TaxID=2977129 RepID=UPI0021CE5CA3|nr:hypothetical protein [Paenibacillus sp. J5C2022]MCU6709226.1 hypothetical protein [Paenibacillus sp. J5C2022]